MRRAVLIVMLDVMVLSVLALNAGKGSSHLLVPAHRWSEVIARGLEKEKQMEAAMLQMRDDLLKARDLAALAMEREAEALKARERLQGEKDASRDALEEAKLERESAKASKRLAEEREKHALDIAAAARKREAEAVVREKESVARREEAERLTREAERSALEAEKRAGDAVTMSAVAESKARLAEKRVEDALIAEREAIDAVARARAEAKALELRSVSAETVARKAEETESYAMKLAKDLQAQIKEGSDRVELAMVGEATAIERARLAEVERERIESDNRDSLEKVIKLRESLAALEQKGMDSGDRLDEARKRIDEYRKQLEAREEEGPKGSVWIKREQALRLLQVVMVESEPGRAPFTRRKTLFLPRVKIGNQVVVPVGFDTLGFGVWWYQSKVDRYVSRLAFALGPVRENPKAPDDVMKLVRAPLSFDRREPRVCMVESDVGAGVLDIIPLRAIKEERIQRALLFKSGSPDTRIKVEITPSISGMLKISAADTSVKESPEAGDYVLTEDGRFIGLMVDKSACYPLPSSFPTGADCIKVTLSRSENSLYYVDFVRALEDVRKLVRLKKKERKRD